MLIILFLLQTRLINLNQNKNGNVDSFIKSDLVKKQNN